MCFTPSFIGMAVGTRITPVGRPSPHMKQDPLDVTQPVSVEPQLTSVAFEYWCKQGDMQNERGMLEGAQRIEGERQSRAVWHKRRTEPSSSAGKELPALIEGTMSS
jgi:hypothetical protein